MGEWKEEENIGNSPRQKETTTKQEHGELTNACPGNAVKKEESANEP